MSEEKSSERLAVLAKIDEYEKKGWFNKDVEPDPPTIQLKPGQVDYTQKKLSSKIKTKIVNSMARAFIKKMIKEKQLIIKEVRGMENFLPLEKQGAIITCNHFNAFDNFAVYKVLEKHIKHRELYKVIREGNYTNFPGLFGTFFRNCNTLPLSSSFAVMKEFMAGVKVLLDRGEKILIYPEQCMWWNYRKPRPLTPGAFRFAVENNVPVIPLFITMNDSEAIGADGFPIQEYTVHILPAIYPMETGSSREKTEDLKNRNYEAWKKVYEETYGIPLTYSCDSAAEKSSGKD